MPAPKEDDPRLATAPPGTVTFIGDMPIDENGMDTHAAQEVSARREAERAKRREHAEKVQAALEQ